MRRNSLLLPSFAVLACLFTLSLFSVSGQAAGDNVLTAAKALELAHAENVTIVDVRSPQEWRQTGVPAGAAQVTIHDPGGFAGFVAAMSKAVEGDLNRPIALICARGNRSTYAQRVLREAGFTQVYNIREGMFGSQDGPGWLSQTLPTEPCRSC